MLTLRRKENPSRAFIRVYGVVEYSRGIFQSALEVTTMYLMFTIKNQSQIAKN